MGMDAKIFVRYVGEPPTQEQIDKWNKDFNYKINTRSFGITKSKIKVIGNEEFTVLDMDVYARHFCEYYDRGNILYLCSIAEWIEHNFTEFAFEILYGKDHDDSFILFDEERRRKLKNHFYSIDTSFW